MCVEGGGEDVCMVCVCVSVWRRRRRVHVWCVCVCREEGKMHVCVHVREQQGRVSHALLS